MTTETTTIGSSVIEELARQAEEERLQELKETASKKHLFQPGQSGNPAGRKKGSKNKHTLLKEAVKKEAEEMVLRKFKQIVDTTIKLAEEGDSTCLKIVWDRILPKDADKKSTDDKLKVEINIGRLGAHAADPDVDAIEAEVVEVIEDGRD
jgi:hypothetical protein